MSLNFPGGEDEPSLDVVGQNNPYVMRISSTNTDASLMLFSANNVESSQSNSGYWIGCSNVATHPILVVGSNTLDTFVIDGGYIGIGTVHPTAALHIENNPNSVGGDLLRVNPSVFVISMDGNIGIGTSTPTHTFHCLGDIYVEGEINMYRSSDARIKRNVSPASDFVTMSMNVMKNVHLKQWNWADDRSRDITWGWIAQEVEREMPSAVHTSQHRLYGIDDFKTINYDDMLKCVYSALQCALQRLDVLESKCDKICEHFPYMRHCPS